MGDKHISQKLNKIIDSYITPAYLYGSKTGLVMKKKGKNRRPVPVPASPQTTGKRRRATYIGEGNDKSLFFNYTK